MQLSPTKGKCSSDLVLSKYASRKLFSANAGAPAGQDGEGDRRGDLSSESPFDSETSARIGGNADLNRYSIAANDLVNGFDALGLKELTDKELLELQNSAKALADVTKSGGTRSDGQSIVSTKPEIIPIGATKWFKSRDEAAIAALKLVNPISIKLNRELGGLLVRRKSDGLYGYTQPIVGRLSGVNPMRHIAVPKSFDIVGDFHTHGNYSNRLGYPVFKEIDSFDSDRFSPTDLEADRRFSSIDRQYPAGRSREDWFAGYLGTPSGFFYKDAPSEGFTGVIFSPYVNK